MIQLKQVMYTTDFSDFSKAALKYALSFCTEYKAKLYVLHAIEPPTYYAEYYDYVPIVEDLLTRAKERMNKELDDIKKLAGQQKVEIEGLIREGTPFVEIIKAARENEIDLIVIATHGRSGLSHAIFGSTAEKVIRGAPCPVLSIRPAEHSFVMP